MNEPVELSVDECEDLLHGNIVGRAAMATPRGPRIVPVNYAIHDRAIVFRTTPYSELGTYGRNTDLAFEIDHLDFAKHQGWSVVAIGRASLVDDPDELNEIRAAWDPAPWAAGARHLYLKLRWREISGRRLGVDWTRESMMPVRRAI